MRGFEVTVETHYLEKESDPSGPRYVFAYTITIANRGPEAATLKNRYWKITNGDGAVEEVRARGGGEQPRIEPETAFRYTSGCVLETIVGTMEGHYEFSSDDDESFDVPIAPFTLAIPNAVH